MEFLKALFGAEALTYDQLAEKLKKAGKDGADMKLADLSQGGYVSASKYADLEADKKALQDQLKAAEESLKAFEGVDPANLKAELEKAQTSLAEAKTSYEQELAKRDSRAETEKTLSSYKFINDITRKFYVDAIEAALEDPANKGKGRKELFDALTQENGKPKEGVFLVENPNKLPDMPPAGGGDPQETDEFEKRISKYKKGK